MFTQACCGASVTVQACASFVGFTASSPTRNVVGSPPRRAIEQNNDSSRRDDEGLIILRSQRRWRRRTVRLNDRTHAATTAEFEPTRRRVFVICVAYGRYDNKIKQHVIRVEVCISIRPCLEHAAYNVQARPYVIPGVITLLEYPCSRFT